MKFSGSKFKQSDIPSDKLYRTPFPLNSTSGKRQKGPIYHLLVGV